MSRQGETFFTTIGCMDGRVQEVVAEFGRRKFGAMYPDTITEAGLVGQLANNPQESLLDSIKQKLSISLEKHHSKGIIVHGHEECAGNPVEEDKHKDDVRKSVQIVQSLINSSIPVVGVFVKRFKTDAGTWKVEEISPTVAV